MTAKPTLISHHLCPYVQRIAISLAEKGVPFERLYVDLANKPDWFTAISPLGKVLLLRIGKHVIFESTAILEYIEDTGPAPLHPADPLMRARHRAWIEFCSSLLNDIAGLYSAADGSAFADKARRMADKFERIENELGAGPWFAGQDFSLVDTVFGPVFRYFEMFDRIGDFAILSGKPKLQRWRANLAARPSIRSAVGADYPERLLAFIEARQSHLSTLIGFDRGATIDNHSP